MLLASSRSFRALSVFKESLEIYSATYRNSKVSSMMNRYRKCKKGLAVQKKFKKNLKNVLTTWKIGSIITSTNRETG